MSSVDTELPAGGCRLTLTNEASATALACALARSLSATLGFNETEQVAIELGIEEAVSNVVRHAFPAGELHSFDVHLEPAAVGLEVRIRDHGQPFDPSLVPDYDPDAAPDTQLHAGLGMHLIRRAFDEVEYRNLGHAGKELRLLKYRELTPIAARTEPLGAAPLEPEPVAELRLFQADDALEVARLAHDTYGYTYPYEHLYFPERLAALNASGELVSAVAVTAAGRVAGHMALMLERDVSWRAELGIAMTRTEFRGQRIAERMTDFMGAEAKRRGLGMLFSNAVTTHPYSQRLAHKTGFRDCGLLPGYAPTSVRFRKIDDALVQRESAVLIVHYLDPSGRSPRAIALPDSHRELLAAIYAELDIPIDEAAAERAAPTPAARATVDAFVHASLELAYLKVARWGEDGFEQIRARFAELRRERLAVIELQLPLADPTALARLPDIEALGFIVSGVWPGMTAQQDRLLLVHVGDPGFDYKRLVIASKIGQRIRDYVAAAAAARTS